MKFLPLASFVLIASLLLPGCSSNLSSLEGDITFVLPHYLQCETYGGSNGEISTGDGEILGSIAMLGLRVKPLPDSYKECQFRLEGQEINLNTNVLVINFSVDEIFSGRWILQQSDFSGGQISLRGGTPWSD